MSNQSRRKPRRENQVRLIKMFGLAALTAIAAMAFVGATSAMAESTQLCSVDTLGAACPAGSAVTSIHATAEANEAKKIPAPELLTSISNVKCEKILETATALALGAPQIFHVTLLDYINCTCTVTPETLGLIEVLKEGNELATVKGVGFVIKVECSGFTCWYGSATGHGLGPLVTGDNGHVTFTEAVANKVKGLFCPSESKLDALFINSTPVYIAS
jgi:hypothetical protein